MIRFRPSNGTSLTILLSYVSVRGGGGALIRPKVGKTVLLKANTPEKTTTEINKQQNYKVP